MVNVPADIVHQFTFSSPFINGQYDHQINVRPLSKKLSLSYPSDKGDWTITHTKERGTITFSLSWTGIRAAVLKDLEVTQTITCTGRYVGASQYLILNHKASSTSAVNYLAEGGKVWIDVRSFGDNRPNACRIRINCNVYVYRLIRSTSQSDAGDWQRFGRSKIRQDLPQ